MRFIFSHCIRNNFATKNLLDRKDKNELINMKRTCRVPAHGHIYIFLDYHCTHRKSPGKGHRYLLCLFAGKFSDELNFIKIFHHLTDYRQCRLIYKGMRGNCPRPTMIEIRMFIKNVKSKFILFQTFRKLRVDLLPLFASRTPFI